MNNRERFNRTVNFEPVDHPPLMLAEGWPATRNRWADEGLPRHVDLYEYFGLEPCNSRHVGIETVFYPPFEERIIEESADYIVKINRRGVTEKNFKDSSSMPEFIDYPIKSPEAIAWLGEKLCPDTPGRIRADWLAQAEAARAAGKLVLCNGGQYFAFLNEHVGTERLLYMYYDAPDFIHRVNELQCALCESALNTVLPEFKLDYIGYHEDMAYKNGSMIPPDMFREFMTPYYKRITGITGKHSVDIHYMDSDGDIRELIPLWLECGIRLVSPLEVAAGMDVVALRREYGKQLAMLAEYAHRKAVYLMIEPVNGKETDYLTTISHAVQLCEQVDNPWLAITADWFHMHKEESDMEQALRHCGKWLKNFHISEKPNRTEPAPGGLDLKSAFNVLREIGYRGYTVLECRELSGPANEVLPQSVAYLRKIAAETAL